MLLITYPKFPTHWCQLPGNPVPWTSGTLKKSIGEHRNWPHNGTVGPIWFQWRRNERAVIKGNFQLCTIASGGSESAQTHEIQNISIVFSFLALESFLRHLCLKSFVLHKSTLNLGSWCQCISNQGYINREVKSLWHDITNNISSTDLFFYER